MLPLLQTGTVQQLSSHSELDRRVLYGPYWALPYSALGPPGGINPLSSSATSTRFTSRISQLSLDVAKVWVKFGLDPFPHKVTLLKCGNLASFSDIRYYPFPFVNEMVRKAHDNSSQVVVSIYVCIIVEAVHDGKAIDDIQ